MYNKELLQSLKNERDAHIRIVESLNVAIKALEYAEPNNNYNIDQNVKKNDSEYDINWQISEKVKYFFKKEPRFLHNRELSEMAHEREPKIDIEDFVSKFASVLSRLKKEGLLTTIQIGKSLRNTFWGSKDWIDENGGILPGHEINEKFVYDKDKSKVDLFN